MTQARRTAGTVARAALWVMWAAVMLLAPSMMGYLSYVESVPEEWGRLLGFWSFVPWSVAIPLALVAAALGHAYRDRLLSWRRAACAAAAVALVAYLGLAAAYYLGLGWDQYGLRQSVSLFERVARYAAWCLWGVVLAAWVMPAPGTAEPPASPLDGRPGADALTEREREVAELLVSGSTQAQAAEALGISASSVSTYRSRACEKLGLASLDELVPPSRGAAAQPPKLDVGRAGSLPLMALALFSGMIVHHVTNYSSLASPGHQAGVLAFPVLALTLPWLVLLAYARLQGMRLRHRETSGRLALVLIALAGLGLCAGGSQPIWVELPSRSMVSASVPAAVGYDIALVLLAPHLLWPHERVSNELDVERCVLYLRGRGSGELQARVLVEIALGRSAPEICESLHVARGTVSAYRAQGYERLGVHSSRELADLLARDVGFVPSAGKNQPSADSEKSTE